MSPSVAYLLQASPEPTRLMEGCTWWHQSPARLCRPGRCVLHAAEEWNRSPSLFDRPLSSSDRTGLAEARSLRDALERNRSLATRARRRSCDSGVRRLVAASRPANGAPKRTCLVSCCSVTGPRGMPKHPVRPPSSDCTTEVGRVDDALASSRRRSRQDDAGASVAAPRGDDSCGRSSAEAGGPAVVLVAGASASVVRAPASRAAPRRRWPQGAGSRSWSGLAPGVTEVPPVPWPTRDSPTASRLRRMGVRGLLLEPGGFGVELPGPEGEVGLRAWTRRSGLEVNRDRSADRATRRSTSPAMEKYGPRLDVPVPVQPLPKEWCWPR